MSDQVKVALIGLDTSHTVEFARKMNDPSCPPEERAGGMRTVSCLRFSTPFQNREGLDKRQKQLESWGIPVTRDFDEAVRDSDAIMLEINDPSRHLEYFRRCAGLGKPVFIDKPLADTIENGRAICDLARSARMRVFSASSLRFVRELAEACAAAPQPVWTAVYGALGKAPAGSSIIWYGVHAFEMLQRAMGPGAASVHALSAASGVVGVVEYPEGRRGVVELTEGSYLYGGCLRTGERAFSFAVDVSKAYISQLREVESFFKGAAPSCRMDDALEVMAMLDAAERSLQTHRRESLRLRIS